ncbi:Hypothetical predicted protein [Paramuricea clavata]|uniref:Uncharacterized protein n=1 Tax=Paramuricea clavata TaxID=317549 RepID=A0A7D9HYP3_PARCT|nr:Hypothetical predicted protein [Paramuricea clavata]
MMLESQRSSSLWKYLIFLAFLTACMPNTADNLPHDILNENSDIRDLIEGDVHYYRLVWDPTSRTVSVFNISGISPLHIILIRKNIGHCEMFFLRLKAILLFNSMIACVGELSATNLKQNCKWVNNSNTLNINQGNIYGMPGDCGPWYLTIYTPGISNDTELSVEVSEPYDPLAFRWFRVTSNLAFVPAIYLALKRRFHAEAIIYVLTCIMSSIYHLCEAEFHCFKGYSRLHYSDYYVSDLSIVATIWTMTRIEPPIKHLVFLAVAIILQFAVTETFSGSYHFWINLILSGPALVYICVQCVYRTVKYRRLYPSARRWIFNIIPGFSLATTAAVLRLCITEPDKYYYLHCIWHITIMLSVAFLLPIPTDEDPDERWWMDKMDRDSYTPLLGHRVVA